MKRIFQNTQLQDFLKFGLKSHNFINEIHTIKRYLTFLVDKTLEKCCFTITKRSLTRETTQKVPLTNKLPK